MWKGRFKKQGKEKKSIYDNSQDGINVWLRSKKGFNSTQFFEDLRTIHVYDFYFDVYTS